MKPRHQVSRAAIELIKRFEGYRRQAAQLPDGRWTIGYGHTRSARKGATVSEQDAEALLIYDLMAVARSVIEWTFTPLSTYLFTTSTNGATARLAPPTQSANVERSRSIPSRS